MSDLAQKIFDAVWDAVGGSIEGACGEFCSDYKSAIAEEKKDLLEAIKKALADV